MGRTGGAGRVIAGTARGIRLDAAGERTRPLGDRVKEALFAILEPDLRAAMFLDLFAGTGAGGIEALSRGASGAVFVERDAAAIRALERNLAATHLRERARVVRADALGWLRGDEPLRLGPFAAVLLDPPYDQPELLREALAIVDRRAGDLLVASGTVVAKHGWRESPPSELRLLASVRERRFGETTLTFYRLDGDPGVRPRGEEEG